MISICRYEAKKKEEWNDFNKTSKNSLFMFDRNYMEYHSNRFIDHSLMFYDEDDRLIALLPMNENENKLISHGGLTYGGFITNERMKQHIMNECFDELLKYGKENGYKEIKYTHISTHLISGKTIGKNSIRHRQYTCPRYTDANHRKDHHSCVIQQIERNQPCPS